MRVHPYIVTEREDKSLDESVINCGRIERLEFVDAPWGLTIYFYSGYKLELNGKDASRTYEKIKKKWKEIYD